MNYKTITFTLGVLIAVTAGEENKNPIIDFFEAPLKALRTKPGEAVAVFEPQFVRANNGSNGWNPGQALGNAASTITDWIAQRVPLPNLGTTTETPEEPEEPDVPEVVLKLDGLDQQAIEALTNKKTQSNNNASPGDEDDDDDEEDEDENEVPPKPNAIGSITRHGFRNGVRSKGRYGPGGYPVRSRLRIGLRNRYNKYNVRVKPNYYDFNDYYRPPKTEVYLRPMSMGGRPSKKKKTYKTRPYRDPIMPSRPNRRPKPQQNIQVVMPSQFTNQLPLLIPVQTVSLGGSPPKKRKQRPQIKPMMPLMTQNDNFGQGLGGFTYIPIPLQQFSMSNIGVDSIPTQQLLPQLQVLAQHTHTIQPEEPQLLLEEEYYDDESGDKEEHPGTTMRPPRPRPPRPSRPTWPTRPSRPSRPPRPTRPSRPTRPTRPSRRPRPNQQSSQFDPWGSEIDDDEEQGDQENNHKFDADRHKPVVLRIEDRPDFEQSDPESLDGYGSIPNSFITIGEDEPEEETGKSAMQGRGLDISETDGINTKESAEIPKEPILGSETEKEKEQKTEAAVSDAAEKEEGSDDNKEADTRKQDEEEEKIIEPKQEIVSPKEENMEKIDQIPVVVMEIESLKSDAISPESTTLQPITQNPEPTPAQTESTTAIKSETTPEIIVPLAEPAAEVSVAKLKIGNLDEKPQISPAQLSEIKSATIPKPVNRVRSEIVHEKPNGHFVVTSGSVDDTKVPVGRSQQFHRGSTKYQTNER